MGIDPIRGRDGLSLYDTGRRLRRQAQDEWVRIIRQTSITERQFWRECMPGYYYNEGEELFRSHLGEPYSPGFYALDRLLQEWRDQGDMEGLAVEISSTGGGGALRSSNRDRSAPAVLVHQTGCAVMNGRADDLRVLDAPQLNRRYTETPAGPAANAA